VGNKFIKSILILCWANHTKRFVYALLPENSRVDFTKFLPQGVQSPLVSFTRKIYNDFMISEINYGFIDYLYSFRYLIDLISAHMLLVFVIFSF